MAAAVPVITALSTVASGVLSYKAQKDAAKAVPAQKSPTPLPVEDDEAARRERMKAIAGLSGSSGRQSTMLTSSALGDSSAADTRSGILSMG